MRSTSVRFLCASFGGIAVFLSAAVAHARVQAAPMPPAAAPMPPAAAPMPPAAAPTPPAAAPTPPAAATDAPPAEKPIRVAVIGASASAGFGCVFRETRDDGEYAGGFRLVDMVRLACPELRLLTSDLSSGFFFMSPVRNGTRAAARAKEFAPDCVIALDFLFWYCYGDDAPEGGALKDESQRLAKLELGLKELESFDVPVLVGDIPDMSRAVGKMLSRMQVPSEDTLRKANARFAEWAKTRSNVRVVPLAAMQRQLMEERALDIAGERLVATKDAPLLQRDELHPAPHGLAGLACAVAEELKSAVAAAPGGCDPDPRETVERARGELKPARRVNNAAKAAGDDGAKAPGGDGAKAPGNSGAKAPGDSSAKAP